MRKIFMVLVLLALVGAGVMFYALLTPYAAFDKEAFVVVKSGTSTQAMASQLTNAGVIRNTWSFMLARAANRSGVLQAGEYHFARPHTTWEVFRKIARGEVFFHELTIPEGSNMFDIAASLDKLGFVEKDEFLRVARSPALIRDIAPGAPTLEGYLFPSTYRLTRSTTAEQIARQMTGSFRKVWQELRTGAADVNRIVTLASLVEKETAVPEERPEVAAVYQNRLNIGMKLDCDPTTIYAALLQGRYRGTIYRSDLDSDHPYNTYRNPGLPPGPIANPGRDSLRAAMNPARVDFLYFVAKPNGRGAHVFSRTLAEHNSAVQQYRNAAP